MRGQPDRAHMGGMIRPVAASVALATLALAPTAFAAPPRADLTVQGLSERASATSLTASATIANAGKAPTRRTTLRFRLGATTATASVKALKPGQRATVKATLKLPA